MNESLVRISGAFLDTLYLNVCQTDSNFQIVKKKLPDELKFTCWCLGVTSGSGYSSHAYL
ncbi:hypothetical protein KDK_11000 [Dictyobacter kobayashii]|uniref:Uncharacterized protein n=1 Tax=Dictyobacter kobayashii TaxID=2014872 RepID=A0A402ADW9_9CHLR|nr:hypothetical protein KDK_11000 [Dictyobacter kobayashii]